jgi:hypothetical protein
MKYIIGFALVVLVALAMVVVTRGRSRQESVQQVDPNAPILKIWVFANGDLELEGKAATLDSVGVALRDLAVRKGVVFYGRESADQEPHPNGMGVIKLVADNRLPIRLSQKRDFSDTLGR